MSLFSFWSQSEVDSIARTKNQFSQKYQLITFVQGFNMEITEDRGEDDFFFHKGEFLSLFKQL